MVAAGRPAAGAHPRQDRRGRDRGPRVHAQAGPGRAVQVQGVGPGPDDHARGGPRLPARRAEDRHGRLPHHQGHQRPARRAEGRRGRRGHAGAGPRPRQGARARRASPPAGTRSTTSPARPGSTSTSTSTTCTSRTRTSATRSHTRSTGADRRPDPERQDEGRPLLGTAGPAAVGVGRGRLLKYAFDPTRRRRCSRPPATPPGRTAS